MCVFRWFDPATDSDLNALHPFRFSSATIPVVCAHPCDVPALQAICKRPTLPPFWHEGMPDEENAASRRIDVFTAGSAEGLFRPSNCGRGLAIPGRTTLRGYFDPVSPLAVGLLQLVRSPPEDVRPRDLPSVVLAYEQATKKHPKRGCGPAWLARRISTASALARRA